MITKALDSSHINICVSLTWYQSLHFFYIKSFSILEYHDTHILCTNESVGLCLPSLYINSIDSSLVNIRPSQIWQFSLCVYMCLVDFKCLLNFKTV